MNLKQIEARIAKLEATRRATPLAGLSEEEIEHLLVDAMDRVATEYGSDYEATAAALQASSDPVDQKAARGLRVIHRAPASTAGVPRVVRWRDGRAI